MAYDLHRGAHLRAIYDGSADRELEELETAARVARETPPGETPPTVEEIRQDPALAETPANVEDATFKKRYSDLRRHADARERELKAQLDQLRAQLDTATKKQIALPARDEDVEAWVKEYPDLANIVKSLAIRMAQDVAKDTEAKLKSLEEAKAQLARESAEAKLRARHPDINEIRNDPDFHEWAKNQSRMIRHALYDSDDWEDCAAALDLYKAQTRKPEPVQKPKVVDTRDAALAVDVGRAKSEPPVSDGKRRWKESEVAKLKPWEYTDAVDEEITQARREGRFIYDLSGGSM